MFYTLKDLNFKKFFVKTKKEVVFNPNLFFIELKKFYENKNKEIIITAKKDSGLNVVSVTDQGIGIPKESIHRITERFFTVDPSKSRSVGGTGLGLAIVKHLVSQHRAEMDISSIENEGTTIDIKFNPL